MAWTVLPDDDRDKVTAGQATGEQEGHAAGEDGRGLAGRAAAAEAKAAEIESWLDLFLATSQSAIGIISTHAGRYVRANQAMADMFGMTVADILAADPYALAEQITHPDELIAEQKLFAELAVGARPYYRLEKRFRRTDGAIRTGLLTMSALHEERVDSVTSVKPLRLALLQIIDITEHKALAETLRRREEELRHAQKLDGIGRLAAGVAHDFNNLLTVITGHGEVLKALANAPGGPTPSDLQEGLEAILAASERAASLTAQLLAHGRRAPIAPRTFVLSEAVTMLQRLLGRTIGSDIRIEQSLLAEGAIFADQGQVGQVVMNLILNARDAIPEGGRIALSTRDLSVPDGVSSDRGERAAVATADRRGPPGPGEWVVLTIADDGHGMGPEVKARMFEPFFTTRGDRPGTQGTGLGLATVKRIVDEIGGFIDVESTPGAGTAVTIFFRRATHTPSKAAASEQLPQAAPAPNSQRVLVIEDEPSVRSLVANVLLGAHYMVRVARDGEEGLAIVASEATPFDLIVTDMVMPSIGGKALAKRLAERGGSPRMLFISGYNNSTPAEIATLGRLLPKPFTPAQLIEAVRLALADANPSNRVAVDSSAVSH